MNHCDGSPSKHIQADCGAERPHHEHDFTEAERVCPGAPEGFEGDCGYPGDHGEHPLNERPVED